MVRTAFRTVRDRFTRDPWRHFTGVTLESPSLTSVMAVQPPPVWDTEGWLDVKNLATQRRLQEVEDELHKGLDDLLAMVYAWRDQDLSWGRLATASGERTRTPVETQELHMRTSTLGTR